MKQFLFSFFAGSTLLFGTIMIPLAANALKVTVASDNIIANRLEGRWEASQMLTHFLGGELPADERLVVEFIVDNAVVEQVPQQYEAELFGDRTVYGAGQFLIGDETGLFFLSENNGNPRLILMGKREGDRFISTEIVSVMLAAGQEQTNDLLFIGDNLGSNEQAFLGFVRSPYPPLPQGSALDPQP